MTAKEFRFVDTAIDGPFNRNHVVALGDFHPRPGARDCYTTYLRFTGDLVAYMQTNANEKGKPSVRGYPGPALAAYLPFDFDDEEDPSRALTDARRVVQRWMAHYDVPTKAIRVFFSGCKGFSIELPGTLFGGFEPSENVADRLKRLAVQMAPGTRTLDLNIYEKVRLWRVPNTINAKSGLYKVPLTIEELLTLDLAAIKALAAGPREINIPSDDEWTGISDLQALWEATALEPERRWGRHPDAAADDDSRPARLDPIVNGCAWLRHCRDDAATLPEPEWYAMLSIVGRCTDGERVAHDWSKQYPQYDEQETAEKLRHAVTAAGPRSCQEICAKLGGESFCAQCPSWSQIKSPIVLGRGGFDDAELPTIQVNDRQFADVAKDAWAAMQRANDPPCLFVRDGRLVGVKTVDGAPRIGELSEDAMYGRLARIARWIKVTKTTTNTFLPKQVAKDMLADPDPSLPLLHAVIETPVFGRGGHVLVTPGYHRDDALWLSVPASLAACCPPTSPTAVEIAAAGALLRDDLLVDFQFATDADRAHAVAAILLQFVRRMINGCTPLHLIEAASPGTGKGLLADVISLLSTGKCCAPTTLPREDAEVRKKITSILMTAPPTVLLDNVGHTLDSADLASALTADPWQDRLLGTNRTIQVPNKATWLLTANNPSTSLEMARRAVRIRIEPGTDRPWQREGFKHDPLRTWVQDNRARLVGSALLLIQAWVVAGRPAGTRVLGSFEEWGSVMGGILEVAGIPGFLGNLDELYEEADEEGRHWRGFCAIWWDTHAAHYVSANDLRKLAEEHQLLGEVFTDSKNERSASIRLGKALHDRRGRHFGPWQIAIDDKDPSHTRYRLVRHDAETTDSTGTGTVAGAGPEEPQPHGEATVGAPDHASDGSRTSAAHRDEHRDRNSTSGLGFSEVPDVSRCLSPSTHQDTEGEPLPL